MNTRLVSAVGITKIVKPIIEAAIRAAPLRFKEPKDKIAETAAEFVFIIIGKFFSFA